MPIEVHLTLSAIVQHFVLLIVDALTFFYEIILLRNLHFPRGYFADSFF